MCLQSRMGKKSCVLAVLGELLSTKNESWKKYKKSWKRPGILFYYFCTILLSKKLFCVFSLQDSKGRFLSINVASCLNFLVLLIIT